LISLASEVLLERIRQPWRLSLEELVCRDGDGHFPRFRVNEIRQRENRAIDDPDDHREDRQKAEQAGHVRASGGELTLEIVGDGSASTNMFAAPLQESLATVSAGVV
jgi:hypothetical protein